MYFPKADQAVVNHRDDIKQKGDLYLKVSAGQKINNHRSKTMYKFTVYSIQYITASNHSHNGVTLTIHFMMSCYRK